MPKRNNEDDSRLQGDRRPSREERERALREAIEAAEDIRRNLIKLEVLNELSRR